MVARWRGQPAPGIEDLVVVATPAGFERRDQADFSTLDCEKQEIFLVLNEPAVIFLDLADDALLQGPEKQQASTVVAQSQESAPGLQAREWAAWATSAYRPVRTELSWNIGAVWHGPSGGAERRS